VTDYGHSQEALDWVVVGYFDDVVGAAAAVDVAPPQPGTPPSTWLVIVLASCPQFLGLSRLP